MSYEVRIHAACKEAGLDEAKITEKAVLVGLDKIDYSKGYSLRKTGSKRGGGYSDGFLALRDGEYYVIGGCRNDELFVWIYGVRYNGEWFKTSPVIGVTEIEDGYKIETENSTYELRYL